MAKLFQTDNGRIVMREDYSAKMNIIESARPERADSGIYQYEWDERGVSELFALCYNDLARYCQENSSWYTYSKGKWVRDEHGLFTMGKLVEFTRLLTLYANGIEDSSTREKYLKFCSKLGNRKFRENILRDATNKDALIISAAEFDANPFLINCQNGTLDLNTFEFHPHNSADLLTMMTAIEYKPGIICDRWERFINEIMLGDADKIDYVQKALGYSITGDPSCECMFLIWGSTTRNGKSTMLNTIEHLLGDYSSVSPVSIICKQSQGKNAESAAPMIASLKGKRFVTMAESEQYGKLDEEAIKQMTGGEEIKARNLYEKPVTFLPQFTLWLSCNALPIVNDRSLFYSSRLRVIEMNRHFREEEQDNTLKSVFKTADAMQGIFNWLVEGYRKFKAEGLQMPESVKQTVKKYEKENDLVAQFLDEHTVIKQNAFTRQKDLYDAYKNWCKQNGSYVCTSRKLSAEMDAHSERYTEKKIRNGYIGYADLQIKGMR